jgi:hypothetical protein
LRQKCAFERHEYFLGAPLMAATDPDPRKPKREPEHLPSTPDGTPPRPGNPIDEPAQTIEEAPGPDRRPDPIDDPDEKQHTGI